VDESENYLERRFLNFVVLAILLIVRTDTFGPLYLNALIIRATLWKHWATLHNEIIFFCSKTLYSECSPTHTRGLATFAAHCQQR